MARGPQSGYHDHMPKRPTKVGSRELKTRLGTYLRRVRNGETILVTDRGEPVAELRPLQASDDATEAAFRMMAAEGLVTRGKGGPLHPFKPIRLPRGVSLSEFVSKERDESW
ncbi:MAG: type II toxin-antitoxin system Phd/YefM family antitoxin [Gemmatimonadaceae bacterium]